MDFTRLAKIARVRPFFVTRADDSLRFSRLGSNPKTFGRGPLAQSAKLRGSKGLSPRLLGGVGHGPWTRFKGTLARHPRL
jgi:hypothetical protein